GMSTLHGACPFAKPKAKAKDGGKKQKASIQLDFEWVDRKSESKVVISVRPHLTESWAALELADTASKEDIKRQYHLLSRQHHPDKNQDDLEAATERFQRIKDAYQVLKDLDGELAFPWDQNPDKQQVVAGPQSVLVFAKIGMEACEEHHLKGLQLRHMAKTSGEVRALQFEPEVSADGFTTESWVSGLCMDSPHFVNHLVKIHRKDVVREESDEEESDEEEFSSNFMESEDEGPL
ncbi:unnamed protein product, partial [Polarella glacialis]